MIATGGVVKISEVHRIGDGCCSHCIPFPDPDYSKDFELMVGKPDSVIPPIIHDMSTEELEKEIAKSVRMALKVLKSGY